MPSKTDTALAGQGSLFPILVGSQALAKGSKEAAVIEGQVPKRPGTLYSGDRLLEGTRAVLVMSEVSSNSVGRGEMESWGFEGLLEVPFVSRANRTLATGTWSRCV